MTLEEFRTRWIAERPMYQAFAACVQDKLRGELKNAGILCEVSARAKEVSSLLTKVIRKDYTEYEQVTDKAGIRIIAGFPDCSDAIDAAIRATCDVQKYEDKGLALAPDQFGYSGKHYEVVLRREDSAESRLHGLSCEVQVHTRAQNLWSDVAHELTYKPALPPPEKIQRSINRLVALVELFDEQLIAVQSDLRTLPDFQEAAVLYELEKSYYHFVARRYDRELSLKILAALIALFSSDELGRYSAIVEDFVTRNHDKFAEIFAQYANDDRCSPLLFQPECIAIFERLEKDPFQLKAEWDRKLPPEFLNELATIWGVAV
jgi:ppGpp synthetase/RelA/SpoT-type nucleotidyltranferase